MKKLSFTIFGFLAIFALILFQGCNGDDEETAQERTLKILQSKNWTVSSVVVPSNTATDETDWLSFAVSFSASNMSTSGHPVGAQAVWPSGIYTVSEGGNTVTRSDGVVMTLNPISDTNFTTIFTVPVGTHINGRIAALDGEYRFNMK